MLANAISASSVIPLERMLPIRAAYAVQDKAQPQPGIFSAGLNYQAEVLSQNADLSYQVRIDGTLFKMQLGDNVSTGQTITLRYLSNSPDPTFILVNPTQAQPPESEKILLSQTAQSLGQLLNKADESIATITHPSSTVLTSTPEQISETAANLKNAISNSGLFYETHLADFLQGKRTLETLQKEPQNILGFDPTKCVAQQLTVMEHNKFHWQGEVWPQQNMEWTTTIQKRPEHDQESKQPSEQAEYNPSITSVMKLNFSNLGVITAQIHLQNGQLKINFETQGELATQLLKKQSSGLALALQSLGQKLENISVNNHGYR